MKPIGSSSGTLVVLDDSRCGLPWLRERGLISDNLRVAARKSRALHTEHGT
jgi:hypothetical protein